MTEEYRASFRGKKSYWVGWIREKGNNIFAVVPSKLFPWRKKEKLLASNIKHHIRNYSERKLMDLNSGITEHTIRCFPFDIHTFEPYYPDMNPELVRELTSLRSERDFLFQYSKELEDTLQSHGMSDIVKKDFKAQHDFFMSLKPPGIALASKDRDKKTKK